MVSDYDSNSLLSRYADQMAHKQSRSGVVILRCTSHDTHERVECWNVRIDLIEFVSERIPTRAIELGAASAGSQERQAPVLRTDDVQALNIGIGQAMVRHGRANTKRDFCHRVLGANEQHTQRSTEDVGIQ